MPIRAGELRDRPTVELLAREDRDAAGQPIQTWTPLATVWAKFTAVTASQRYGADRFIATEAGTFLVRTRRSWGKDLEGADLTEPRSRNHRLDWRGRKWTITGVQPLESRDGFLLTAEVPELGGVDQE